MSVSSTNTVSGLAQKSMWPNDGHIMVCTEKERQATTAEWMTAMFKDGSPSSIGAQTNEDV